MTSVTTGDKENNGPWVPGGWWDLLWRMGSQFPVGPSQTPSVCSSLGLEGLSWLLHCGPVPVPSLCRVCGRLAAREEGPVGWKWNPESHAALPSGRAHTPGCPLLSALASAFSFTFSLHSVWDGPPPGTHGRPNSHSVAKLRTHFPPG